MLLLLLLLLVIAAGAAGVLSASGSADSSSAGKVKLTFWLYDNPPTTKSIKELTNEFEKRYPNIQVTLVSRDFGSYPIQVKLALSSRNPPDVVEGNNGYALDSSLVAAHLLLPLDKYAKKYGWLTRWPASIRREWQFSEDGKSFGRGPLWAISHIGEIGGWYYNKQKLSALGLKPPTTLAEFEQELQKAKSAGETPIMFGDIDGWEATHLYNTILDQLAPTDLLNGIAFTNVNAKWTADPLVTALTRLQQWAKQGYLYDGYGAINQEDAEGLFIHGKGVFLQCGSWCTGELEQGLGKNLGYFLPPPRKAGETPGATGALSIPIHIAAKSKHPDEAALYLNWLTSQRAETAYAAAGQVPATPLKTLPYKPGSVAKDVYKQWVKVTGANKLVPYLDWSLPTTGSPYYAELQEVLAGKTGPAHALDAVQAYRLTFYKRIGVITR